MRLAIDVRCLQDKQWTGVASYTWNYIKQFSVHSEVHKVFFGNRLRGSNLPPELSAWGQVKSRRIPNKLQDLAWRLNIWPGIDTLLGKNQKIDCLWIPNPHFFRIKSVPTAITIHDLSFIHFPEFFAPKTRWWYLNYVKGMLKKQLPSLPLVITVSENTKNDLLALYPKLAPQVKVVHPGVEDIFFETASADSVSELRNNYKLPSNYILSVGTLEPRKNHRLLLDMYQQIVAAHPNWEPDLVIAGPVGWAADRLYKYAQTLPCRNRIRFLGFVPRHLQPALYQQADLFLYPSFYEGFGFPVLEAMASGVPCVVSDVSSLPEIVGGSAILVSPWQADDWVQVVYNLHGDIASRNKLKFAGQTRAKNFLWQKSASKLLNLFQSI